MKNPFLRSLPSRDAAARPAASWTLMIAGLATAVLFISPSSAEEYPNRAIRMVVPFSPGGPVDLTGRQMALKLHEILQQPVVVENRPGANGTIGTSQMAK